MNDPHIWWYVTRASALLSWVLMTLAVLWGILLSTRLLQRVDNPGWLQDLHRYLGGMSVIMAALHMVSLMLDGWLRFTLAEVLVPFATDFKPLATALGILAFYALVAVQGTSLVMNRLPRKFWKILHYLSYVALVLISFHAGLAGTDSGRWWYQALAVLLITSAMLAVLVRIILGNRSTASAANALATTSAAPSAGLVSPASPVSSAGPAPPAGDAPSEQLELVVVSVTPLAADVLGMRLSTRDGSALPLWAPGAHLTLHLPGGLQRHYSLCGDPADRSGYDIAVLRLAESPGGGSRYVHDHLAVGHAVIVSAPRNHFPLEPARDYLFIAGGIGITPIKAMIESLPAHREWRLVYTGRSRTTMAFVHELSTLHADRVVVHAADEQDRRIDIAAHVGTGPTEVYACGPAALMDAASASVPAARLHLERFVPVARVAESGIHPITVTCSRGGEQVAVAAEQSILEALEASGRAIVGSCRKGVCGTCEVRVLDGTPEHLDSVLTDEEKNDLGVMYPCVSRATGATLTLDI